MIYLTTVLKLNPAFVSGLILTVRLIDCFWSPVVGRYIDNNNPKLGKYRSYLLYGGIPLTAAACLLMLPQAAEWSMTMKIVYATVSYTVLSMIYSVVNIPYGSIMASMTRDNDEVLILTSTRMVCANIGQIVVQAGFPIGLAMCVHEAIDWNQATWYRQVSPSDWQCACTRLSTGTRPPSWLSALFLPLSSCPCCPR